MLNIKWGAVAGTAALILSLAVGAVSGNNMFYVLLRALVFGAVFFGLGLGSWVLISSFIPELFYADSSEGGEGEAPRPGSRVNITLGGGALPEMYRNPDNPEEVGNISDLITGVINPGAAAPTGAVRGMSAGGMDQNREDGYTYTEGGGAESQNQDSEFGDTPAYDESPVFKGGQSAAAVFTPSFGSGDDLGGLPDLDAMAGAFLTNAGVEAASMPAASSIPSMPPEPALPERKPSGNKAQPLKGDFNPKELAEGIRTVLSKET
jgi:hypothetical protein